MMVLACKRDEEERVYTFKMVQNSIHGVSQKFLAGRSGVGKKEKALHGSNGTRAACCYWMLCEVEQEAQFCSRIAVCSRIRL